MFIKYCVLGLLFVANVYGMSVDVALGHLQQNLQLLSESVKANPPAGEKTSGYGTKNVADMLKGAINNLKNIQKDPSEVRDFDEAGIINRSFFWDYPFGKDVNRVQEWQKRRNQEDGFAEFDQESQILWQNFAVELATAMVAVKKLQHDAIKDAIEKIKEMDKQGIYDSSNKKQQRLINDLLRGLKFIGKTNVDQFNWLIEHPHPDLQAAWNKEMAYADKQLLNALYQAIKSMILKKAPLEPKGLVGSATQEKDIKKTIGAGEGLATGPMGEFSAEQQKKIQDKITEIEEQEKNISTIPYKSLERLMDEALNGLDFIGEHNIKIFRTRTHSAENDFVGPVKPNKRLLLHLYSAIIWLFDNRERLEENRA